MHAAPLKIPRTLALRLMHELQTHGANACGLVSGEMSLHALKPGADAAAVLKEVKNVWAAYDAGAPHPQFKPLRRLLLSVETAPELRGVLKMRCYENGIEQSLTILENT